jgi:hypothetical protein
LFVAKSVKAKAFAIDFCVDKFHHKFIDKSLIFHFHLSH